MTHVSPGFKTAAEVAALRQRAAPAVRSCHGLPGAPGWIEVTIAIDPDGEVLGLYPEGNLNGTQASACVENALAAAAEFAPAEGPSALVVRYEIEATP